MTRALAILLAIHGFAHLVGFVVPWRLASLAEMPYKTTIFAGRVDVGASGIRVVGVCWLLAAMMFFVAAYAVAAQASWASRVTAVAVVVSLALCASGLPASRIGLFVNLGLALLLVVTSRMGVAPIVP